MPLWWHAGRGGRPAHPRTRHRSGRPRRARGTAAARGAERVGRDRVDEDAARAQRLATSAAGASASSIPSSRPAPRTWSTPGSAAGARGDVLADRAGVLDQVLLLDRGQHGQRGGRDGGRAAERRRVVAALEAGVGLVRGQQGADRQTAGEALRDRDRVGPDAGELGAEPGPAAADAGLHLVVEQQCAVAVAQLAREPSQPASIGQTPPSPWIGSTSTAQVSGPTAAASASRSLRGRARSRPARARTARAWRPTSRPRASPACGRGRRPRRRRCGAWPGRRARAPRGARA